MYLVYILFYRGNAGTDSFEFQAKVFISPNSYLAYSYNMESQGWRERNIDDVIYYSLIAEEGKGK